jgi:hypothetical protein
VSVSKLAAGICFLVPRDRAVFLIRRSDRVPTPLVWSVPSGIVERGEGQWEAAQRETIEEAGSLPRDMNPVGLHVTTSPSVAFATYFVILTPAAARAWRPRLNWESSAGGWFSLEDPPEPLHPGMHETLNVARRISSG